MRDINNVELAQYIIIPALIERYTPKDSTRNSSRDMFNFIILHYNSIEVVYIKMNLFIISTILFLFIMSFISTSKNCV